MNFTIALNQGYRIFIKREIKNPLHNQFFFSVTLRSANTYRNFDLDTKTFGFCWENCFFVLSPFSHSQSIDTISRTTRHPSSSSSSIKFENLGPTSSLRRLVVQTSLKEKTQDVSNSQRLLPESEAFPSPLVSYSCNSSYVRPSGFSGGPYAYYFVATR